MENNREINLGTFTHAAIIIIALACVSMCCSIQEIQQKIAPIDEEEVIIEKQEAIQTPQDSLYE